jgi:DNA-binding NtrC family response regulator
MSNHRSLLVVSDDPDQMDHLTQWFSHAGYQVAGRCSSGQALQAARSTEFQVAVLDLGVSAHDGLELFWRLKEYRPQMWFILLSDRDPVSCEGREEGVCASLEKPFAFSELEVCIEEAFELAEADGLKSGNRQQFIGAH